MTTKLNSVYQSTAHEYNTLNTSQKKISTTVERGITESNQDITGDKLGLRAMVAEI